MLHVTQWVLKTNAQLGKANAALHASCNNKFVTLEINAPLLLKPVVRYKDPVVWLQSDNDDVDYRGMFDAIAAEVPHHPRHHMKL